MTTIPLAEAGSPPAVKVPMRGYLGGLHDQWRDEVRGVLDPACDPAAGTWRDVLVWDKDSLIQRATHPDDTRGKEAIAHYRVIETFAATSLIEVRLHTGKRNQIRIQARLRGHTLVGEQRYTYGPDEIRPIEFPRQALHAHRLAFQHPVDGRELRFEAPLPEDFAELLKRLRR